MLRITVELVPFGEESAKRAIAQAVIYNDGTGDILLGNYVAGFCEREWVGSTVVQNHDRRQSVWALVRESLKDLKL